MKENLSFFIQDKKRNRTLCILFDNLKIEQDIKRYEHIQDQILKGEA